MSVSDWTSLISLALFILASIAGVWWRMNTRIESVRDEVDALELKLAQDYVSTQHLKEVETRLTTGMQNLVDEIRGMRQDLLALYRKDGGQQ